MNRRERQRVRLVLDCIVLGTAAFIIALMLGACTPTQLQSTNARLVAAEAVAYTACQTRANAPIVARAMRDTLEDMVPGGSIARGVIAASCEVVLANPGTTLTFTVPKEP